MPYGLHFDYHEIVHNPAVAFFLLGLGVERRGHLWVTFTLEAP